MRSAGKFGTFSFLLVDCSRKLKSAHFSELLRDETRRAVEGEPFSSAVIFPRLPPAGWIRITRTLRRIPFVPLHQTAGYTRAHFCLYNFHHLWASPVWLYDSSFSTQQLVCPACVRGEECFVVYGAAPAGNFKVCQDSSGSPCFERGREIVIFLRTPERTTSPHICNV